MFAVDFGNNRVLRFDNAAAKANGANADGVLGQTTFTSNASGRAADSLFKPVGLALTLTGSLFVSDGGNVRVVRFDNAASKANGANADGVLGQPDFTSANPAAAEQGKMLAAYLAVDAGGTLYAGDIANNRVLIFKNAAAKANGANADLVLGQANFTSSASATTASNLNLPQAIGVYNDPGGRLLVADAYNHRVLRFSPTGPLGVASSGAGVASSFGLGQNYPNPFNPSTTIRYELPASGFVSLQVFNVLGQEVATLVHGYQEAGARTVSFRAENLQSGVYYYRLTSGSFVSVKKMTLVK